MKGVSGVKRRMSTVGNGVNGFDDISYSEPGLEKKRKAILSFLECPVCGEIPRVGDVPVLGCRNGHIICDMCAVNIKVCPTCREKDIQVRNLFAERYIEVEFKDIVFKCKYQGCEEKMLMAEGELKNHEKFCKHRDVSCPAAHHKACSWKGPLSKLLDHGRGSDCFSVVDQRSKLEYENGWHSIFRGAIMINDRNGVSVFDNNLKPSHWKPYVFFIKGDDQNCYHVRLVCEQYVLSG